MPVARDVLHVAIDARLLHYRPAGIGTYIRGLTQGLDTVADNGAQFTVLISRKDNHSPAMPDRFRAVKAWTPCHSRYEQMFLPLELFGHGFDVLHSPDFIPPFARRCKSVITIHDLAFLLYPDILTEESRRYYSQVHRAAESADAIISVSNSTKRDIVQELGVGEDKVFVVHNGVGSEFRPVEDARTLEDSLVKYGIERPFILFVGTLEPRKNLPTLLRAFAKLDPNTPGDDRNDPVKLPRLVIVGRQGWLCDNLNSEIRGLGISERVIFTGHVEGDDLVALYNASAFLVQPSLYEGFGLPPLEAMACGTPCIVSNTSSLPEIVGDAALKVDPLDVQGWTQAMMKMLTSADLRERLRAKGLARSTEFTWEAAARKTLEIYQMVGKESSRS